MSLQVKFSQNTWFHITSAWEIFSELRKLLHSLQMPQLIGLWRYIKFYSRRHFSRNMLIIGLWDRSSGWRSLRCLTRMTFGRICGANCKPPNKDEDCEKLLTSSLWNSAVCATFAAAKEASAVSIAYWQTSPILTCCSIHTASPSFLLVKARTFGVQVCQFCNIAPKSSQSTDTDRCD